jgi:hypothetical protein
MCSEENGKKEDEACCNPEEFKGMSEMMEKCFSGKKTSSDCSDMMDSMKKKGCCTPKTEKKVTGCCG